MQGHENMDSSMPYHYFTELQQFLKPARLSVSSHDTNKDYYQPLDGFSPQLLNKPHVVFSHDTSEDTYQPLDGFSSQLLNKPRVPVLTEAAEEEVVNELLRILVDCFQQMGTKSRMILLRKFFSQLQEDIPSVTFILEKLGNSRVEALPNLIQKLLPVIRCHENFDHRKRTQDMRLHSVIQSRSLDVGEDPLQKLECFKIRTVTFGEVAKPEENKDIKPVK